jgi:hypothetical protein
VPLRFRVYGSVRVRREKQRQATFAGSRECKIHVGGNCVQILRCNGANLEFAASRQEASEAVIGTESRVHRLRPVFERRVERKNRASGFAGARENADAHSGAVSDLIEILDDLGVILERLAEIDGRAGWRNIVA